MRPRAVAKRAAKVQRLAGALNAKASRFHVEQRTLDQAPSVVRQPVLGKQLRSLPSLSALPIMAALKPQDKLEASAPRRRVVDRSRRHKHYVEYGVGSIEDLQAMFDVDLDSKTAARDAVLVAIDTESERSGLISAVVEIGITTLRLRDILDVPPGEYLSNWTQHMSHHHLVLDYTRKPKKRMASSLFGHSQFLSANEARATLKSILQACCVDLPSLSSVGNAYAAGEGKHLVTQPSRIKLVLVGHDVRADITALAGPGVRIDLHDPGATGVQFKTTFDTLALAQIACSRGARILSARLGPLVRCLGVDPRYVEKEARRTVVGAHNASNDAAYTIMALLFFATRWDELVAGRVLSSATSHPVEKGSEGQDEPSSKPSKARLVPRARLWAKRSMRVLGSLLAIAITGTSLWTAQPTPDEKEEP